MKLGWLQVFAALPDGPMFRGISDLHTIPHQVGNFLPVLLQHCFKACPQRSLSRGYAVSFSEHPPLPCLQERQGGDVTETGSVLWGRTTGWSPPHQEHSHIMPARWRGHPGTAPACPECPRACPRPPQAAPEATLVSCRRCASPITGRALPRLLHKGSLSRGRPKCTAKAMSKLGPPPLTHSLGLVGHTGHLGRGLSHGADVGQQAPGWYSSPQDGSRCRICCGRGWSTISKASQ